MEHLTQEQLVEHYYGEPGSAEIHLAGCDECRREYQALQRVLNSVEGFAVPEPREEFEAEVWQKIAPAVTRRRVTLLPHRALPLSAPRYRVWAGAAAIAAMLVVAFFAGQAWKSKPGINLAEHPVKRGVPGSAIPVLVVAVGDHLERVEAVLREIENTQAVPGQLADISFEQQSVEDLLDSNRLYRQSAAAAGDLSTASVLEDLENVLIEINHQPSKVSAAQLDDLRREIKDRGSLFKATVLGSRLRGEEATL
jgi:hypothetical protein